MQLLFTCPSTGQSYSSEKFDLINNRGIVIDGQGNRVLKADVVVRDCPHCGIDHTFAVDQLSCPWSAGQ